MVATPFPSSDPIADRRASYAGALAQLGDLDAAIEVLEGAMQLVPHWAAGWFQLGEYLAQAGRTDEAAQAWERAIGADPADTLGAGLKRDLLLKTPIIEEMPAAFVETLFDQYAADFDRMLVDRLGYCGPAIVMEGLGQCGFTRAATAIDLGCGTGLMGAALRDKVDVLTGYDLSGGMLAEARAKRIYDRLEKRDIARLEIGQNRYDLIVAADVFIYLGALERIIGWCAGSLAPGGMLAFTLELGQQPVELRESRRFAHSSQYMEDLLRTAGFAGLRMQDCILRRDRGENVAGLAVVASAMPFRRDLEPDGEAEALA